MSRSSMTLSLALAAAALIGGLHCATSEPGPLRFANQEPVWRVNDRVSIPKPAELDYPNGYFAIDAAMFRPITYTLEVPPRGRATNVNSLDEVPDSTWFTNRNGVRPLSVDEIRRGPGPHAPPDPAATWTIVGSKNVGVAVGFRVRDPAGDQHLLKFDPRGHDEVETGADVAVQRLLWAAGYNVPENEVLYISRDQLVVGDGAEIEEDGRERPMSDSDVARLLTHVAREPDGTYRVLASRLLPGVPIGGIQPEGTRSDDPNDTVPHEERREMRGLYTVAAWVNHTDIKPANTLDVWTADPADPRHHYVVHYLLDFGKALGSMNRIDPRPEAGFAYSTDLEVLARDVVTLGMADHPWDGIGRPPPRRGLGWIESRQFDPERWKPLHPWIPFQTADRFDRFWGAKLVLSFTEPQIRAALEAARYTDPVTIAYLTRTLVERQRKIGRSAFRRVAPLDRFAVRSGQLCFDDLWLRHRLGPAGQTRYAAVGHGDDGEPTGWRREARPDPTGRACLGGLPALPAGGYFIMAIEVSRPDHRVPPVQVHLATPAGGGPVRVIGLRRE